MPITLRDTRTERALHIGGATIRYVECGGDAQVLAMRRALSSPEQDRDEALLSAEIALCAAHVGGWDGVVDAAGTAIPWPSAACDREALMRAMPMEHLVAVMSAVQRAAREAADSGKG